jgi:D-alanine transfer protein
VKRLMAFFTALVLFLGVITGVHLVTVGGMKTNNPAFGGWTNMYKYASHEAVAENLNEKSILFMGSSEFNHGQKYTYHPKNMFKGQDMSPMIIGTAYTQSLYHAITLAAMDPHMKNRKVALILSPQWFDPKGVKPEAYAIRFSESNYLAMLKNNKISMGIKKKIGARSEKLLKKDPAMAKRVAAYNRLFLDKKGSINDHAYYFLRSAFVKEKDRLTVMTAMRMAGISDIRTNGKETVKTLDWNGMAKQAEEDGRLKARSKNFYIKDSYYNKKIKAKRDKLAGYQRNASYDRSPEYDDFRLFLEICKERGIKPLIIMIPVNGYWYDHTGFAKERRQAYYENIRHITGEYDAKLVDFSQEEYTPYFMEDTIHIGWKGWVRTNESLYKFYKEM